MKDAQIQIIKEDRDRGVGMYKDLHESSFAAARGYEGRQEKTRCGVAIPRTSEQQHAMNHQIK
jgi:hypothetical protein